MWVVFESVLTLYGIFGAAALASVVVVDLTIRACWVRLRTCALTELPVEDLPIRTTFLDALTTTRVWVVFESVLTLYWVFRAAALACVVIIDLTIRTCWVRFGACTLTELLVEDLSIRATFLDALTTTCIGVVHVSVITLGTILWTPALASVVIVHLVLGTLWLVLADTPTSLVVPNLSLGAPGLVRADTLAKAVAVDARSLTGVTIRRAHTLASLPTEDGRGLARQLSCALAALLTFTALVAEVVRRNTFLRPAATG